MSLRLRLVVGLVTLVAVGLTIVGFATHATLRHFLTDRVDEQLESVLDIAVSRLGPEARPVGSAAPQIVPRGGPRLPTGTYAEIRRADGSVIESRTLATPFGESSAVDADRAVLPEDLAALALAASPQDPVLVSAPAVDGSGSFRLLAVPTPAPNRNFIVVGLPLDDLHTTLDRIDTTLVMVSTGVLLAVIAGAWSLVGLGLRPLARIGRTAHAIAEGDLSQRVTPDDPRTEIGRLGNSLNTMLGQIEEGFEERRASEERLRRFVSDASHELRTPLTSIRGHAELFRRGAADRPDDLARSMRRIEEESARMGGLVEDLLLLARLDEGRPVERAPVDLSRLADDAVADAAASDGEHHFVTRGTDVPVVVSGDEPRLRQVLANLVTNARVHTPPGTTVAVATRVVDGTGEIEVHDDGPGIEPEHLEQLFERFYRVDKSRARATGGSGLGLAIVSAIVDAHDGTVHAESAPGRGTTFTISIPIAT